MDTIKTLNDFLASAKAERKYADNSVRAMRAALKLFDGYLTDTERGSLDELEKNLDNIVKDIYAKEKNGVFSSKTLIVYRQRVAKIIRDYREYGSSPGKMASWNPRRTAGDIKQAAKTASPRPKKARQTQEAEIIDIPPMPTPAPMLQLENGPTGPRGGISSFDAAGRYGELNRSEIHLREGFKITLEMPVDLSQKEADRLKKYIDLMVIE